MVEVVKVVEVIMVVEVVRVVEVVLVVGVFEEANCPKKKEPTNDQPLGMTA